LPERGGQPGGIHCLLSSYLTCSDFCSTQVGTGYVGKWVAGGFLNTLKNFLLNDFRRKSYHSWALGFGRVGELFNWSLYLIMDPRMGQYTALPV